MSFAFLTNSNWESRGTSPPCESRAEPLSPSADGETLQKKKSAKGVWGKTRVFPHKQHVVFVEHDLRNSPVDCFGSIMRLLKRAPKNRAVPLKVHDVLINQSVQVSAWMTRQKQSTGLFLRKGTFVFNMLLVGENSCFPPHPFSALLRLAVLTHGVTARQRAE